MGYNRSVKLLTGRLLLTGTHDLSVTPEVINSVNFPGLIFEFNADDDYMELDTVSGEYTCHKNGILFIDATSNYEITTGNSRIEIFTEKYTGLWEYLLTRSATFPSLGPNQVHMSGQATILKGQKLRFSTCVSIGSGSFSTEVLPNTSIIPAGIMDFNLWS